MAVFKCKMCGGDLDVTDGAKIVECDYCGISQTVACADDEKKVNLFNRANAARINNDFARASGIYETIVAEFPNEAEAYWGMCLCTYGIEYVDDPRTGTKIPTCHRTSYKSIYNDENYMRTLECADTVTRQMYCREANIIDELQKDILKVVNNVEPYDVFICYKETGADGQRTRDSVMAQDIYDALAEKGYKVFFSRITLEDRLGKEYEPYIFAALNTARVMLAIGTNAEHYNAVWVKNEWSRYLDLMGSDKDKTLIPCYCDINPYDMPPEFRNLQGQDMGKIGFKQDLVRGIGKLLGDVKQQSSAPQNYNSYPAMINTFESTVAAHIGPALIGRVGAIGTNDPNDTWPQGTLTSTVDMNQFSVIMFQIYLSRPIGYNGQAKMGYAIFDPNGNIFNSDESTFNVQSDYDRFAQGIVLRGSDGTKVQTGQYRAVFWVNDSQAATFVFSVTENSLLSAASLGISNMANRAVNQVSNLTNSYSDYANYSNYSNYSAPKTEKSKTIALLLAFFFGAIGLHDFYLGHKVRGVVRIILSLTGYGSLITGLWALVDCVLLLTGKTNQDANGNPIV